MLDCAACSNQSQLLTAVLQVVQGAAARARAWGASEAEQVHAWPIGVKRVATVSAGWGTDTCLLTPEEMRSAELGRCHTLCQGSSSDDFKESCRHPAADR